jgi:hypothetical protein
MSWKMGKISTDEQVEEETALQEAATTKLDSISRYFFGGPSGKNEGNDFFPDLDVIKVPLMNKDETMSSRSSDHSCVSYDTFETGTGNAIFIRFQVVVWYVGRPDEVLGKVDMKFRVTIFWNAPDEDDDDQVGYGMNNPYNRKVWKMHGRQRAYKTEISEMGPNDKIVYVPPVSILNAVDIEVLGAAEVCLLNTEENLMKWTCLYKGSLLQDNMHVSDFPHDSHDLVLRLGILKHRQPRKRWDKARWKLDLASKEDSQGTIEIPHGTIVNHVKVPGFSYEPEEGLQFEFLPIEFGQQRGLPEARDQCLQVKLRVTRESSYYDRNIVPLLVALNTVGVCTLAATVESFGARGEMILACAFVEIGIRMTVDSRLPVVGYQIKMQWVLNNFFFGLLFLVMESSIAYLLHEHGYDAEAALVDRFAACFEFFHMYIVLMIYFIGSRTIFDNCFNCFKNQFRYSTSN